MMENKVLYDSYNNDEFTIIEHGIYKGRVWCIRMRKYPCAYFEKHKSDNEEIINDIVHGGTSWEGPLPNSKNQEVMKPHGECEYWGWDYGHIGDYQGQDNIFGDPTDKKWTSEEIVREIYRAIDSTEK